MLPSNKSPLWYENRQSIWKGWKCLDRHVLNSSKKNHTFSSQIILKFVLHLTDENRTSQSWNLAMAEEFNTILCKITLHLWKDRSWEWNPASTENESFSIDFLWSKTSSWILHYISRTVAIASQQPLNLRERAEQQGMRSRSTWLGLHRHHLQPHSQCRRPHPGWDYPKCASFAPLVVAYLVLLCVLCSQQQCRVCLAGFCFLW